MKQQIQQLVSTALQKLVDSCEITPDTLKEIHISRTKDSRHGDYATNIAMVMSKSSGFKPYALAQKIVGMLPQALFLDKVEIAHPGFINFFISAASSFQIILDILEQKESFGRSNIGDGRKVLIEYVSANPTGPLHVGHGRGAVYGACVADLLEAIGYEVEREYYINDAGRQMDILATSVWLRYLELTGQTLDFPTSGYKGDYVWDIAATLHRKQQEALGFSASEVFANVPADEDNHGHGDKETHIDGLINNAKKLLGIKNYQLVFDLALNTILDDIKNDLGHFVIEYQQWFSERALVKSGAVNEAIDKLEKAGYLYSKSGAKWFRATEFGDEKDRVVIRENGQMTYFATDIAYHLGKYERGFEQVIDIWGADHHGYVPRLKAAMQALGQNPKDLDVRLVQFVALYRNGQKVAMGTRSGEFVTLRQLRKEVGADAARFFYVLRKSEQHLDFDLELAKHQSSDNPVYYVQYAHARICAVFRQAQQKGISTDIPLTDKNLDLLNEEHENALVRRLTAYPDTVLNAAKRYEPHLLCQYLRDLAHDFHTYYNAHPFLVDDVDLRDARLKLILAISQVLSNGLSLLGVSAPEKM